LAYILGRVAAELARSARDTDPAGLAREPKVARARHRVARARRRRGVGARDAGGRVVGGLLRVDGASGACCAVVLVEGSVEGADGARQACSDVGPWNLRWYCGVTHKNQASNLLGGN